MSEDFNGGAYALWWTMTIYLILAGRVFLLRHSGGKWENTRVIETAVQSGEEPNLEASVKTHVE